MGKMINGEELRNLLDKSTNEKLDTELKGKRVRVVKAVPREFVVTDFMLSADSKTPPLYCGFVDGDVRISFDSISEIEILNEK